MGRTAMIMTSYPLSGHVKLSSPPATKPPGPLRSVLSDIVDGVTFANISGSRYPSQLPSNLFARDPARLS